MMRVVNFSRSAFFVLLMIAALTRNTSAQDYKQLKEKSEDAFAEVETDSLVLRFFDAITGNPVKNGDVTVAETYRVRTDFEGRAFFPNPGEDGFINIKFSHPDYAASEFKIEIMAGTIFFNRFSVSPRLPIGALCVVVDWGESPRDLDAHFVKTGDYHISFRNMRVSADGSARLDRDDIDGFGPETITASNIDKNAEYVYYIHDFTNQSKDLSQDLSNSKATVKVFGDNKLLNIFQIQGNQTGKYWEVFRIRNGQVFGRDQVKTALNY